MNNENKRNEFRWNKKRKHYAYLFKTVGSKRLNILITTKKYMMRNKRGKTKIVAENVPLFLHPSHTKEGKYYLIAKIYFDDISSFDTEILNWYFDINDKRKVKRIKKIKK